MTVKSELKSGYALTLIAPRGGLHGWQWIFVIEGAITILVAGFAYTAFPEFPDNNRFLSPEQTKMVLARVEKDRGDSLPDKMTSAKLRLHLCDWKIWIFATSLVSYNNHVFGVDTESAQGYFAPIILTSMGYKLRDSLLLSSPPVILG
ncbi:hypothetical protein C0995_003203, partial [Termitomyces sp. Mi166